MLKLESIRAAVAYAEHGHSSIPPCAGWASHAHRRLINFLVASAGRDACYVEFGVWLGATLASAGWNNANARCFGVDDFSETWANLERAERRSRIATNLHFAGVEAELVEADCLTLDMNRFPPINVAYYDADHSRAATLAGCLRLHGHLAPGMSVLLVDDIMRTDVAAGVDDLLRAVPKPVYQVLLVPGPDDDPRVAWNEGLWLGVFNKE